MRSARWFAVALMGAIAGCHGSTGQLAVGPAPAPSPAVNGGPSPTVTVSGAPVASPAAPASQAPSPDVFPTRRHRSPESEVGHQPCEVHIRVAGFPVGTQDVDPIFPSWRLIDPGMPVAVLEGTIADEGEEGEGSAPALVSNEDFPTNHFTHDVNFFVKPDETPDHRYTNLLGVQVEENGREETQDVIGVEWETGLGADNDGNPLAEANMRGEGGGFYSGGHRRSEVIWAWPTRGDHVHVEGSWIWDRAHPPAACEIHPPRLVAVQRHLPALIDRPGGQAVATRVDVFASGDGLPYQNNRPDAPSFVTRVPMGDRDYTFTVTNPLPRPSDQAVLKASVVTHSGDTFPVEAVVEPGADGRARVTIPWRRVHAPDDARFARTVYLYWDEGLGVPASYRPRRFRVTLQDVAVDDSQDVHNGQYRLFTEVGGDWLFVNELQPVDNPLLQGLGDTPSGAVFPIARTFDVLVAPTDSFRVYAGGWEADGVDRSFGHLVDPNSPCGPALEQRLDEEVFNAKVFLSGSRDDPIGDVQATYGPAPDFGLGTHEKTSAGPVTEDVWSQQTTDPTGSFRLRYRIDELPWPPQ